MKALVQARYGPAEQLSFEEVPDPTPGRGEVLVAVRAASVNAADWHVMRGDPYLARLMAPGIFGLRGPRNKVRGRDVAGVVEAAGPDVRHLRVGDRVFGELAKDGAFAEKVCAHEDLLEILPLEVPFDRAAALPLAGGTALGAVRAGKVGPGQKVLINGASGGVGTYAVQMAVALGAEVTGVCSGRNLEMVRSLGAEDVIDYGAADFTAAGRQWDVIVDLAASRSLSELRRALTPTGTLVLTGGGRSEGGSFFGPMGLMIGAGVRSLFSKPQRLVIFSAKPDRALLRDLLAMQREGAIRPVVDRAFHLSEAAAAIRYVELEHPRAKVLIAV
ncbi:zinc-binding dehydrogenase [Nakamurella sp. YIM 132087]|uniref:Zinc-binding dehydrogenase n=1 Tax=Nakamurella alba TaxID=2665158 RepID=A0A7K1FS36_9ACTN|nr:NAD(P)-dependent alcohol dehydrogenase [Nakamurella alba]MTD16955.1 zinc-binding dehydrogenase [Nakamurella alba]